jgi:hypothetical protein
MYRGEMVDLEAFVASLKIPADRKGVVVAELTDHVACAREAATRGGKDPDAAATAALGNLEALRRSLEAVEPAFGATRCQAFVRGLLASIVIAAALDIGGAFMAGIVGSLAVLVVAALLAPPHALQLLRAELRAPRVRGRLAGRGTPIGPALFYGFTIAVTPFLIWIGLIVARVLRGAIHFDTPPSSFAVAGAVLLLVMVETARARRRATV